MDGFFYDYTSGQLDPRLFNYDVIKHFNVSFKSLNLSISHLANAGIPTGEIRKAIAANIIPPGVCPASNNITATSPAIPDANFKIISAQQNKNIKTAPEIVKTTTNGAAIIFKIIRMRNPSFY